MVKLEKYCTIKENEEELSINDEEIGYNKDRDKKKAILLEMTSKILDSNTEYARALETNINAFHLAITDKIKHENNHEKLKKNHEKLKERVEDLEKKEDVGSA